MTELEEILLTKYKGEMIRYFNTHPNVFEEAIKLAINDKQPFSWRSAWLLWSSLEINDSKMSNHIDEILNNIDGKKDGHQRELIKILEKLNLNEYQEGKLLNICFNLWENVNKIPSIRYTAFRNILKIAKKYPELANEIEYFTQQHYIDTLSSGTKHSIKKMIKNFKKDLII